MNRRRILGALGAGFVGIGGAGVVISMTESNTDVHESIDYRKNSDIVYTRGDLHLRTTNEPIYKNSNARFEIENTGNSEIGLGCGIAWALQKRRNDKWIHVTWTLERLINLCLKEIKPNNTISFTVPMSSQKLTEMDEVEPPELDLQPGNYRLILVGSEPYLATDFVLSAE